MMFLAALPPDFFTTGTLATLAGCTGIVYAVCSAVQSALNFNPKWLALLVSVLVSMIGAYLVVDQPVEGEKVKAGAKYIIAFLNGFLVYTSSRGVNQMLAPAAAAPKRADPGTAPTPSDADAGTARVRPHLHPNSSPSRRGFFSRWN